MLLNKGMFEGKKVLSEKAVEELLSSQFLTLPVKYAPKEVQGAHFALGSFIIDADAATPSVYACPNMLGTVPFLDRSRNYAAILIVAKPEEEKKPLFASWKALLDNSLK
jgi:hypothetical protein